MIYTELPEHLALCAADLAEWLVKERIECGTLHGATVMMERLADERPHAANYIQELAPDELCAVLEAADDYRRIIKQLGGHQ